MNRFKNHLIVIAVFALRLVLPAVAPVLLCGQASHQPSVQEMEDFLQHAKLVKTRPISTGVTNTRRATLENGTLQHDAHVQCIDEAKTRFEGERGVEMNFVDSWRYNVAAYRLAKFLDIADMVPMSVERKVEGKACAVTWWLDDCIMEVDRLKKKLDVPDKERWNEEMYVVRVFDQLIYNTDSNLTNLLIDPEWRIWMIDHTRAFRLYTSLLSVKDLVKCDRHLLAKLRALDLESMQTIKPWLKDLEIKGVLARRDKIVQFFDMQVREKGEAAVLYDRPAR
jgi:hypothetical protein